MMAMITWGTTTDPEVGGDDEAADSGLAVIGEYFYHYHHYNTRVRKNWGF